MNGPKFYKMICHDGKEMRLFRVREEEYWEACGCSHWGRPTKRDGKRVVCGHKHKTEAAAGKCLAKMKREKPGGCQRYKTHFRHVYMACYKSAKQQEPT